MRGRQVTAIGAATAIIVGCVGITPAGGFVSPGWAMVLGVRRGAARLRGHRLAAADAGGRDARRARRPRRRRLHRHPLHRLLRPGVVERRVGRPPLRQRGPARRSGAGGARGPRLRVRRHLRAAEGDRCWSCRCARREREEALGHGRHPARRGGLRRRARARSSSRPRPVSRARCRSPSPSGESVRRAAAADAETVGRLHHDSTPSSTI